MKAGGGRGGREEWERAQAGLQDGGQQRSEPGSAQHPAGMQALDRHPGLAHRGFKATVNAKSQRDEDQGTMSIPGTLACLGLSVLDPA